MGELFADDRDLVDTVKRRPVFTDRSADALKIQRVTLDSHLQCLGLFIHLYHLDFDPVTLSQRSNGMGKFEDIGLVWFQYIENEALHTGHRNFLNLE